MPDHVHMLISIPPKYSVAEMIGYLKGKRSIWIAQSVERKSEGVLRLDRRAERGDDQRPHQKSGDTDKELDRLQLKLAPSLMKSHLSSQSPL